MSNPFDDDVDDSYFGGGSRPTAGGRNLTGGGRYTSAATKPEPEQDDFNFYEQQIESTMQNTLDSTKRSMMQLEESEQIGVKTAEDLSRQGEQLRTADNRLDEISSTTVQTQRNLNNIKSVFGGIKNYFSKGSKQSKDVPQSQSSAKLDETITTLRTGSTSGFYDSGAKQKQPVKPVGGSLPAESKNVIQGVERWNMMDNEIDENLDLMSNNLSRLRHLGRALGDEVEDQNELLDRLGTKTDKVDTVIRGQDKQMKKILGVKKGSAPKKSQESAEPDDSQPPSTKGSSRGF